MDGCTGARLFGMPVRGVDRLYALTRLILTRLTLSVYLCSDNTIRRAEVICVPVYALYISIYPSRLLRTQKPCTLSARCHLHSKQVQVVYFLTSV